MAAKPKVRAGIAGSGFSATFHYEAALRVYGVEVEVAGVYSPTPANRAAFAEARSIRAFDDLDSLLGEVDVVHVCAPPMVHEATAVAALERGVFDAPTL